MESVSRQNRILIVAGLFVVSLVAVLNIAAVPQDFAYHRFADIRPRFGIANFGDVLSNIGFAVVGLLGLRTVLGSSGRKIIPDNLDAYGARGLSYEIGDRTGLAIGDRKQHYDRRG